ncbi:prepilin peptidase [Pseudomonas fluorescens]|uniref:prepilin peptidase n=1 Tax=Pseudomonas fluorescens TaxID=294 RepID=UPI001780397B|nr:prepilin peptidase [Pseudomonas fluorescens]MBD8178825.1 prepilin peptidase [Pseudomonas fluorescens]MBD8748471.1 prepilin peptidase [Pseudomonas fluorescens]MBD8752532.1 prepilin peptidase [Pseudomonas fluorescens]MBD8761720.1 prepilin peptidase [Pseudomonas fluorescens]
MIQAAVVLLWLLVCAVQDTRQRLLANRLTLGVALLGGVYLFWTGGTWLGASVGQGLWAFFLALLLTLPGYALGRLGAGDVKLLAALALVSDAEYLLGSFIGAAGASVLWLLLASKFWPLMSQRLTDCLGHLAPESSKKLPFAPFLLVGFTLVWLWIH